MNKRYSKTANLLIHLACIVMVLASVLPIVLVFSVSLTSEAGLVNNGYSFWPSEFSLDAYKYIWGLKDVILDAYGVTILTTILGTVVSVAVLTLYAYPLSRPNLIAKRFFTFYVFFTMLFSGGLVSWYMVCTNILHIQNTIWAMILPGVMNAWYIIILRTFFTTSVPEAMIESARIDGAGEFMILFKIVLPVAVPGIATIALFQCLMYWNDWWFALNFVTEPKLYNLQLYLQNVLANIQEMKNVADGQTNTVVANLPAEGARMALCMIAMGPILVVYPFFQKYFIQGLTVGAVKG